jgi:hypothetical protein
VLDDKKRNAIAISVRTFEKHISSLEKAMWLVEPSLTRLLRRIFTVT